MSAKGSERVWAVYDLLVNRNLIAARIASELGLNRSTVSRHIRKLVKEQYIIHSHRLSDHMKRIEATSKRSVTGYSKAYIKGPRAPEGDAILGRIKREEGVRADPALPGGNTAMIDVHRIDYNLPADQNAPRGGLPWEGHAVYGDGKALGLQPGKLNRGWGLWKCPAVETRTGEWNLYLRRRGKMVDGVVEWGEFCLPNPVRVTMPNRYWITVEEAMDGDSVERQIVGSLWEVAAAAQKLYGFHLGMPTSKSGQVMESGALRYDPELAQRVKAERTASGKGMLELADGITADGSHELLKDGFVHLDCETPEQAAMQANPVAVLDHLLRESKEHMEQMRRVADETMVTIEQKAVSSSDSITSAFEQHMATLVERMMNTFEERFNAHLEQFMEVQTARAQQILEAFQIRLEGVDPDLPETQTLLFDFEQP
jgi:hypothetical protein